MTKYDQRRDCREQDGVNSYPSPNHPGFHHHKFSSRLFCDVCGGSGYSSGPWMAKHAEHVPCDYPGCDAVVSSVGLVHHKRVHRDQVVINADPST